MVREHLSDGSIINVERRVRIHRTEIQKPRVVVERRRWAKFGAAAGTPAGPEPGITIIRFAAADCGLHFEMLHKL
jgi:hypothetical protein